MRHGSAWHVVGAPPRLAGVPFGILVGATFVLVSARSSPPPCGHSGEQHPAGEDWDPDSAQRERGRGSGGILGPASLKASWPASLGQMAGCQRSSPRRPSVSQAGSRRHIPGPLQILGPACPSFFRSSYSFVMRVGDTGDGGGGACARRDWGVCHGDLGIGREAQPRLASGPNSQWDLNKRLRISGPVSSVSWV